jgi:hypothetical protein
MAERQYTDEEAAAIFERASEAEHTGLARPVEGKGLTLAALQEIGREVGISPESISLAARSLDQGGRVVSRTFMGLPIGVGRTVEFDQPLSDGDWEALVADLRTTFEARGAVRYDGPFRQWTNGNLQALLEPTVSGHRLRGLMTTGALALGASAVMGVAVAAGLSDPGTLSMVGLTAVFGLGMFGAGAFRVSGWARRRRAQFEEVIARLAGRAQPGE